MKLRYLYSIMCIFSLLALSGCREEEAMQTSEGTRTVTVNLGIAMSRAEKGSDIGDGTPEEMQVWIFESGTNNCLAYIPNNSPVFSGSDLLGELVNTDEYKIELDNNITALDFYVVLNGSNGEGINLDNESTPDDIKAASFTALSGVTVDNEVPAYGCWTGFSVADHKNSYTLPKPIEVTRAVSKLELFFTKSSESAYLKVNSIMLEHIPNKGYINGELNPAPTDITYTESKENILSEAKEISQSLSEDITLGNFSTYEGTNFEKLTLITPYLLENTNGGTWADSPKDYTYPYDPTRPTGVTDENTRYKMTVSYQTAVNGEKKEQIVYLPAMKRNEWNKIFARVKGGALYLSCAVADWEDGGSTDISYAGTYDGELTPITSARISERETNPAYAVVYGGGVDIPALSFTFKITQPIGATWTASLTNGNQFILEGDASGTVVGEEDNEFTFIVRPNQEFSVDDIRETELYITVTTVNGTRPDEQIENGEQIINPNSEYPGSQTRIKIRQVSSEEWNGLQ